MENFVKYIDYLKNFGNIEFQSFNNNDHRIIVNGILQQWEKICDNFAYNLIGNRCYQLTNPLFSFIKSCGYTDTKIKELEDLLLVQNKLNENLETKVNNLEPIIKKKLESLNVELSEEISDLRHDLIKLRKNIHGEEKFVSKFNKLNAISDQLTNFLGLTPGTLISRTEVTKSICGYIKKNDMFKIKENKKIIVLDDVLKNLFGNPNEDVTYFNLQKYLSHHYLPIPPKKEIVIAEILDSLKKEIENLKEHNKSLSNRIHELENPPFIVL
jgi:chromatin remodeling complex protein RSC6